MTRRRGFGSVRKLVRNHYQIRWTDKTGRRRCESVWGTLAQADDRLAAIQLGMHGGGFGLTFAQYYEQNVRPGFARLAARTRGGYERLWAHDVAPSLGAIPLRDVSWRDVQAMVDGIDAPSVQRHAAQLATKILNQAWRERMIPAPIPARFTFARQASKAPETLDAADVVAWLDAVAASKYAPIILCELGGGLRPEEACALSWEDVETWEDGGKSYALARVSKTLVSARGGKLLQQFTKTEGSERAVVIGEPFASRLLDLRSAGWLCPGRDGLPTASTTVTHNFKAWCERRGVRYLTQESLRHVFATLHAEAGSLDSVVSLAMGHGGSTTKARYYQAATLRGMAEAADGLAAYIERQTARGC